jgi:pimeloyl-ACP methyl ester carboxylesterase
VAGFVTVLLPLLIYRSFKVSARAKVGIIWDVLTFWPRRFQPFAVRPYAERAVPELERRILRHLEADRRVIVCAHSQGSILAYAALMELAQHYPDKTANVALVTFGSPLRTLYGKFFPGYFAPGELAWLRERLLQSPAGPCITWKNFYRRTDYIGQALFGEDFPGCDEKIPDPPARDPYGRIDPEVPVGVPADPPQPAWTRALTHSYYNNSLELREWVDRVLPAAMREPRRVEA